MITSKIAIVNMALGFIGERPIADLDEKVPAAGVASLFYRPVLQSLLRVHPWNFAQVEEKLAPVPMPEVYENAYSFAYAFPNQCIKIHCISGNGVSKSSLFVIKNNGTHKILLTNFEEASVRFTSLVEDTSLYDSSFIMAFARALQIAFVKPLLKDSSGIQEATTLFQQALAEARLSDTQEGRRFQDDGNFWNGGHAGFWDGLQ